MVNGSDPASGDAFYSGQFSIVFQSPTTTPTSPSTLSTSAMQTALSTASGPASAGISSAAVLANAGASAQAAHNTTLGLGIGLGLALPIVVAASAVTTWFLYRRRYRKTSASGLESRSPNEGAIYQDAGIEQNSKNKVMSSIHE